MSKHLFTPVKLGALQLKNRFVLAPMTRLRADIDGTPSEIMEEFYSQRAQFGLVLTECNPVSKVSNTYPRAGSLYNQKHVDGWKRVIEKVHQKGGIIAVQLYHCGRSGSTEILGEHPIAPSPIPINGIDFLTSKPYPVPKEMTKQQIKDIIQQFHESAILAKKAGFDGIMLHGANGYLHDQFLRDGTNQRTDEYGGSVENRSRFNLETLKAFIDVFGADRVSLRLSPTDRFNDMYDSNPSEVLKYILPQLEKMNLSFVEVKRNSPYDPSKDTSGRTPPEKQIPDFFKFVRQHYKGNFIANQSLTIEEASQLVESKIADAVSFATLGISNPDLPNRVRNNQEINRSPDASKFYSQGPAGYIDYPFLTQQQ